LDTSQSGAMATTLDIRGMIGRLVVDLLDFNSLKCTGSIGAGLLSDILNARAVAVTALLYVSIPMVSSAVSWIQPKTADLKICNFIGMIQQYTHCMSSYALNMGSQGSCNAQTVSRYWKKKKTRGITNGIAKYRGLLTILVYCPDLVARDVLI